MTERGNRKVKTGKVVSDKMDKSRIILVESFIRHKLYGKFVKKSKKFMAHDETNKSHIGDALKQIAPEWSILTKSYRPVIEAEKQAYKLFRPTKGNMFTKSGENFIKRASGQGAKLAEGEKRFLQFLEGGSDLAVGVGNLSDEAIKIGNEITKLKESIEPAKSAIKAGFKKTEKSILAKKSARIKQLLERQKKLELLAKQREKAQIIQKTILGATAATGVIGGSNYWAGRHILGNK